SEAFQELLASINSDPKVHGALVQLPLPEHLHHLKHTEFVVADKDIDGFHAENVAQWVSEGDNGKNLIPCTPKGIMTLLDAHQVTLTGKHVVVVGRSMIVGKPMAMLLINRNATV